MDYYTEYQKILDLIKESLNYETISEHLKPIEKLSKIDEISWDTAFDISNDGTEV